MTPELMGKFGALTWYTADGRERVFPLESPSLMVGRADTNDLVIDDPTVSRRHARLTIENGRLMVEDLGSTTGTFIDGHPIPPRTPSLVDSGQELRMGAIVARYSEAPAFEVEEEQEEPGAGPADFAPVVDVPASIRVTLIPPATPATPGGPPVVARLLINNSGRIVDQLSVGVLDLPSEWVRITTPKVVLVPGESAEVAIAIQVPRTPEASAGTYEFNVVVTSTETQREVFTTASVVVPQFYDTLFELRPKRSKRNFTLAVQNRGNAFLTYELLGRDDEESLEYDFRPPAVPLQPGEQERVRLRVKGPRRLFGRPETLNFTIVGRSTTDPAAVSETSGQLLVKPPLQRLVLPTFLIIALAAGILGALAYYFWPVWPFDDDGDDVQAEDLVSVVHPLCDPNGGAAENGAAQPTPQPRPSDGQAAVGRFNQNDLAWGDDEYARAKDPDFGPDWCGDTIAQCGCAMTSMTNVMALLGLVTMPDNVALSPRTMNDYLNLDAQRKSRGWVSRGYVFGDVVWSAANQLSAEVHERFPNQPTIRFAGFGPGTDEEIRGELRAGRYVVLAVPGHFIAAVGLDANDNILIHDPFYPERTTLDYYKSRGVPILKSVKFEPSSDLSGVLITAPEDVRIKVTRKDTGEEVGTLSTAPADEAAQRARVEVEGSSYFSGDAFRDPTCTEKAPPDGVGINQMWLPGSVDDYIIEYLNTTPDAPSIAIHSYDRDGNLTIIVRESPATNQIVTFDPVTPEATATVSPTPTPVTAPPGSGTQPGGGGGGGGGTAAPGGNVTPTPTTSPTVSPTAPPGSPTTPSNGGGGTPTPTVTPSPTPAAPSVAIDCEVELEQDPQLATVTCTGQVTGTTTSTTWSVNGVPTPTQGLVYTAEFTSNANITVKLAACNGTSCNEASKAVVVKFPEGPTPPPGVVSPTPSPTSPVQGAQAVKDLTAGCGIQHLPQQSDPEGDLVTVLSCSASFSGDYTAITWTAPGTTNDTQISASQTYTTALEFPQQSSTLQVEALSQVDPGQVIFQQVTVTVTVCNFNACASKVLHFNVQPKIFEELFWYSPCDPEGCGPYTFIIYPEGSSSCLEAGTTYYLRIRLATDEWWWFFDDLPDQLRNSQVQFYVNNQPFGSPVTATEFGEGGIEWERTWTFLGGPSATFRAQFLGAPNFAVVQSRAVTLYECPDFGG